MMYQAMPELTNEERLRGLQPLALTACCDLGNFSPHEDTPLGSFRIEMLLGEPVLRLPGAEVAAISLASGQAVTPLTEDQVLAVAGLFAAGNAIEGSAFAHGIIETDQWIIQSARRNQPAWHIGFGDAAGTEIYINGRTGEVFQQTNRRERILAWLGVIPHWLYPSVLRQNAVLWTNVVIWSSILGTFLAATGLYVGIKRLRRRRDTHKLSSPYKGWWHWHHISGLIFGVLVLTWVFSGLMTMNPWGTLSRSAVEDYRPALIGSSSWAELRQFLAALSAGSAQLPPTDTLVQLTPAVFAGQLFVMTSTQAGDQQRLHHRGHSAPLQTVDIERSVAAMTAPVLSSGLIFNEDSYYYGHKRQVDLPVFRVIMDDAEQTRIYINTDTGAMRSIGSSGRWSRWIRTGLHDLDLPVLRIRPIWDVVVILLLAGVTVVCATGTWMAFRRVRRDFRSVRRRKTSPRKNKLIPH